MAFFGRVGVDNADPIPNAKKLVDRESLLTLRVLVGYK